MLNSNTRVMIRGLRTFKLFDFKIGLPCLDLLYECSSYSAATNSSLSCLVHMASKDSSFLHLASTTVSSGISRIFSQDKDSSQDGPVLSKTPLSNWSTIIRGGPQIVSIGVYNFSRTHPYDLQAELRKPVSAIDPLKLVYIKAQLGEVKTDSPEGFHELGRLLTLLGTENLSFCSWDELNITLPKVEFRYDSAASPALPSGNSAIFAMGRSPSAASCFMAVSHPLAFSIS
ncbi:hypothetical protein E4T56_gene9173 [Termitomyces sp. T112]|nr:hypothetical protein E4T56_gene9173 [Termitomyces sp. T112]